MRRIRSIMAVALLVSGACTKRQEASPVLNGVAISPPIPKPEFTLTDMWGKPFDFQKQTNGKVTLLFFGYTHCPDVCPLQMADIAKALKRVDTSVARQVAVVFITTDSARDNPQRLRQWLRGFDSTFIGLTGSLERVNAIQTQTRFLPRSVRQQDGQDYGMSHSAVVLAFSKDDSAHVIYPSGVEPTA